MRVLFESRRWVAGAVVNGSLRFSQVVAISPIKERARIGIEVEPCLPVAFAGARRKHGRGRRSASSRPGCVMIVKLSTSPASGVLQRSQRARRHQRSCGMWHHSAESTSADRRLHLDRRHTARARSA